MMVIENLLTDESELYRLCVIIPYSSKAVIQAMENTNVRFGFRFCKYCIKI